MRIAILGSGGVGGYFGARLAAAGADVAFIARGAHLAAMQAKGLQIESPLGPLHLQRVTATDDPAALGPVDLVFFTVKHYDDEGALGMLPPLIGDKTLVVPFQNGVDSVNLLSKAVGRAHVAGGTCYVSAVVTEPGHIKHTAMNRLIFGPLEPTRVPVLEELEAAGKAAGIDALLSDKINVDIWAKFARLTAFSGMTAMTRSPIGVVTGDPDLLKMWQAAVHETIAVARARQVPLPAHIFDEIVKATKEMPHGTKSSMLEDLERGRRLELPWLSGAVVRIGAEVGAPTPTHQLITTILKPHVAGHPAGV